MRNYTKTMLWLSVVAALSIAAGSILTAADIYPVANFGRKVIRVKDNPLQPGRIIETILLDLKLSSVYQLPESKHPQGGDLAVYKNEVLVLTNDGLIYSMIGSDYQLLDLKAPDNNWAGYSRVVSERIRLGKSHNNLNIHRLRYNGILVTEVEDSLLLLVSYINWDDSAKCYQNVVDSTPIPKEYINLRSMPTDVAWSRVYASKPCLPIDSNGSDIHGHVSGGKIAVLELGKIVIANADFEWDGVSLPSNPINNGPPLAQDPKSDYGKVIEINLKTGDLKNITSGNRNMQGLAVSDLGDIWTVEHGPRGGDKLNHHISGKNFGWPIRTYGTQYSKSPWPGADPYGRMDGYDHPAFAWLPSVAVSDMTIVQNFDSSWAGDLLIGSLKAESLFRVRVEDHRGVYAEQINVGERIRSLVIDAESRIVLWTDTNKLLVLERTTAEWSIEKLVSLGKANNISPEMALKLKNALETCAQCHSFQIGVNGLAPSLNGLLNRKIGGSSYKGTSETLRARNEKWTEILLKEYLSNPSLFAKDTKMPNPLLEKDVLEVLVSVLTKVNN